MCNLYSSAEEVLVWLGHHREGVDDLVWATTEFYDVITEHNTEGFKPKEIFMPFGSLDDAQLWEGLG
jgi:hypothetical protein